MKNILIPVDFSETSLNAITYTRDFFRNETINFYLLSVYEISPTFLLGNDYKEEAVEGMLENTSEDLDQLVKKSNSLNDRLHKYIGVAKASTLIDAIKATIVNEKIDLIATGTKGASGLKEIFIGSNTVKMINSINKCPILVIPNNYKFQGLHQIVFSTNYKRKFNLQELKILIKIAVKHKASIEVTQLTAEGYMTDEQKQNKKELMGFLEDFEFNFQKIDWQDSETNTIQNFIKETNSELLTLINHKYNFLQKLTEENIIKKSSFHSPIPILVLPEI